MEPVTGHVGSSKMSRRVSITLSRKPSSDDGGAGRYIPAQKDSNIWALMAQ